MTEILAVEICATHFKTEAEVTEWLKGSKYAELWELKSIKFRKNKQSRYLNPREKNRPVWRWDVKGISSYTETKWDRSTPFVIVATRGGTMVPKEQYPETLPENKKAAEEKKQRHEDRVKELRLKRMEQNKNKPPRAPRKRVVRGVGVKDQKNIKEPSKKTKEPSLLDELANAANPVGSVP